MDEPTNHRNFVSSLATRIIDMTPDGIVDFRGTYDEYLRTQFSDGKTRVA